MDITEYCKQIADIVDSLRVKNGSKDQFAAHYTSSETPKYMLQPSGSNSMRQYDGDYMNDPEEGRYLVDVMIAAAQQCSHQHKASFVERLTKHRNSRLLSTAYKKATFISCWTITQIKAGSEESSDSLNHWRFYGDDGKGACLMIPVSNLDKVFPNQLFEVVYGTESRGGGSASGTRPVKLLKDCLVKRLNGIRKTLNYAMDDLEEVIRETHPLLFLFKSSEYASEREVRSIVHKNDYSSASSVQFDLRVPARAYVTGNPGLICNDSMLFYGPKSDHQRAIEVMGFAANAGIDLKVYISSMPYRELPK